MSMYEYMPKQDGGHRRSGFDVLDKEEVEKIVDDKLKPINDKIKNLPDVGSDGGDSAATNINKMIVNKERSKLYSIYYFTTGDPTNFAQKQVEVNKIMTVTGSSGRNTQVTDKQIVTEVINWYNCSRHSISEDESDNTLFLTAGGRSNYGVNYTRIKNKGYMKGCLLLEEGKNMSTLSGVAWFNDTYSFYFSFRTLKPNDENFYFNHKGALGVFSKRKKTESSGTYDASVSGYINQLFVSVFDQTILVVKS